MKQKYSILRVKSLCNVSFQPMLLEKITFVLLGISVSP